MLSQLCEMRENLKYFGLTLESTLHRKLSPQPKGDGYELTIGQDGNPVGLTKINDYPQLYYLFPDNHKSAPTLRCEMSGKKPDKISKTPWVGRVVKDAIVNKLRFMADLDGYLGGIGEQPALQALKELCSRIQIQQKSDDFKSFLQHFNALVQQVQPPPIFYLCLELDYESGITAFANRVQSIGTFSGCSDLLFNQDNAESGDVNVPGWGQKFDFFGGSLAGWNECYRAGIQQLVHYQRNDENPSFARFGLNGQVACPTGLSTRNLNDSISKMYFEKNNKDKLWFLNMVGLEKHLIVSNLDVFGGTNFQAPDRKMTLAEWKEANKKLVDAIRRPASQAQDMKGMLWCFCHNGKNPISIVGEMRWTSAQLVQSQDEWLVGLELLTGSRLPFRANPEPVAISDVPYLLKNRFRQSGSSVKFGQDVRHFDVLDSYRLFFGDKQVAQRMMEEFSFYHSFELARSKWVSDLKQQGRKASTAFEVARYFPLAGLLLHKCGFSMELIMENWFFTFGRLAREAEELNRAYFITRRMKVPDELVGYRYLKIVPTNPTLALDRLVRDTAIYLKYVEANEARWDKWRKDLNVWAGSYRWNYRQLSSQLCQLPQPEKVSAADRIMLFAGFNHFQPIQPKNDKENTVQDVVPVL